MKRAVGIAVTAIDSEYGFTMVNVLDNFTGEVIARLMISSEDHYDADDNKTTTVHVERRS